MTRTKRWTFLSAILTAVAMIGCQQSQTPPGFPETVPFTLTILQGETPIEGVNVALTPDVRNNSWSVSGMTNALGVAEIQTVQGDYVKSGIPVGSYKVTLLKIPDVASKVTVVNDGTLEKAKAYEEELSRLRTENPSEIPAFMNELNSTPLSVDVLQGALNHKINIAEYPNPTAADVPADPEEEIPNETPEDFFSEETPEDFSEAALPEEAPEANSEENPAE